MAVALPDHDFYPSNRDDAPTCFLCAKPFDPSDGQPVVYWVGGGTYIAFHGDCAGSFVLRFARDAWEIQRDTDDGKFASRS